MAEYDVVIVGGGVAGLSCALTLASAKKSKDWAKDKKILVVDAGDSDLKKAKLFNVPGIESGTFGKDVLLSLQKQIHSYGGVDFLTGRVSDVTGTKENFTVVSEGRVDRASTVVLATGFHEVGIASLTSKSLPNTNSPKEGKVRLAVDDESQIKEGFYAAGLLTGASSMFAVAAGSGVQVACNIFKSWSKTSAIIHDVAKV